MLKVTKLAGGRAEILSDSVSMCVGLGSSFRCSQSLFFLSPLFSLTLWKPGLGGHLVLCGGTEPLGWDTLVLNLNAFSEFCVCPCCCTC